MSHVISKFRPAHTIPKGFADLDAEQGATTVGVSGSMIHSNPTTQAESLVVPGVTGFQSSSLYGSGG
jgi:hypothetical protein